jgi:LysM repeat protein
MKLKNNKSYPALPAMIGALLTLCVASSMLWWTHTIPAQAAPAAQMPIYTPTPGPDGRIIYVVKPGDSLLSISLVLNVSTDKLRELNNLTSDVLTPGQQLLIGMGGPALITPTQGPSPTPTVAPPTPTPQPGKGELCIILFNDLNGNSIREEGENSIPNGAISFGNQAGTVSKAVNTGDSVEHQCFKDLPEGQYTLSVAAPDGYNPTTETKYEVTLSAGDATYVNFGAQANSQTEIKEQSVIPEEPGRSPVLGIIGIAFLLAAIGLGVYAVKTMK